MKRKMKGLWLSAALLAALLLISGTVFAEGGDIPEAPAAPAETAESPPAEQPPAPDEPLPDEGEEICEDDESGDVPPEGTGESPAEPAVEAEEAPEADAPEVTLVGADGQPLDMASQESAETLAGADPYFSTGGGVNYYRFLPTVGACSAYPLDYCEDGLANPIQRAIDYLSASVLTPDNGRITVESGLYKGNVVIDASLPNLNSLTALYGQWSGGGYPTIQGMLTISNLLNGFTLDGFTITGGVTIKDSAGPIIVTSVTGNLEMSNVSVIGAPGHGVYITTKGNVTLDGVRSNNNLNGHGAYIDNTLGGAVTVKNSQFSGNGTISGSHDGLRVLTSGVITLNGVSACNNGYMGITLPFTTAGEFSSLTARHIVVNGNGGYGFYALSTKNAPVTVQSFIGDGNTNSYGLWMNTGGRIALKDITVGSNLYGMDITTTGAKSTVSAANVDASNNIVLGINITAVNRVTLTSIRADNTGRGMQVSTSSLAGSVTLTSPAAAGAAGANYFRGNTGGGVSINAGGAVTLTNLDASGNTNNFGAFVDNASAVIGATGGITINKNITGWTNLFSSNSNANGLQLVSNGGISVSSSQACQNGFDGAYLDNSGSANMAGVAVRDGLFDDNKNSGLYILSTGTVAVQNVSASRNDVAKVGPFNGLMISTTSGGVTVSASKPGARYDFNQNSGDGIQISAGGPVQVSGVNAYGNNNSGVWINALGALKPGAITVTRTTTRANLNHGVFARTLGAITLDTMDATGNSMDGANLDNCIPGGTGACTGRAAVTIKAPANTMNWLDGNWWNGLWVSSGGNVSLTNVSASGNQQRGADIRNDYPGSVGSVTIRSLGGAAQNYFSWNGQGGLATGLEVHSNGVITLSKLEASHNTDRGAYLVNNSAPKASAVTVTDGVFDANHWGGLDVQSLGAVNLRGVAAERNSVRRGWMTEMPGELVLDFLTDDTPWDTWQFMYTSGGPVMIRLDSMMYDTYLYLYDTTTWALVAQDDNTGGGPFGTDALINIPAGVLVPGGLYEIRASSHEWAVNGRTDFGKYQLNLNAGSVNSYKIDGIVVNTPLGVNVSSTPATWSVFRQNSMDGLNIQAGGTVVMANVSALENGRHGVNVWANGNVSVQHSDAEKASEFSGNGMNGLDVSSRGSITVNGRSILAIGNLGNGVLLDNTSPVAGAPGVTLRNIQADGNGNQGIDVYSLGGINASGINASYNTNEGLHLTNNWSTSTGGVTLSGVNTAIGNGGLGVNISSHGVITLSNLNTSRNGGYGLYVISAGAGNAVTLTNIIFSYNQNHGAYISAGGNLTARSCVGNMNGYLPSLTQGDGIYIIVGAPYHVLLDSCAFMNNLGDGVEITDGGSATHALVNTIAVGNDTDGSGDLDVNIHP